MFMSLTRVISLRLLCSLLALAAVLICSGHAAAGKSFSAESVSSVEELLTPQERSALPRKARIFAAVAPAPNRTKKLDGSKKAKEESALLSHEVKFNTSGSVEFAAVLPLDDACPWTWTARGPPEVHM